MIQRWGRSTGCRRCVYSGGHACTDGVTKATSRTSGHVGGSWSGVEAPCQMMPHCSRTDGCTHTSRHEGVGWPVTQGCHFTLGDKPNTVAVNGTLFCPQ